MILLAYFFLVLISIYLNVGIMLPYFKSEYPLAFNKGHQTDIFVTSFFASVTVPVLSTIIIFFMSGRGKHGFQTK